MAEIQALQGGNTPRKVPQQQGNIISMTASNASSDVALRLHNSAGVLERPVRLRIRREADLLCTA
jgi:hypothetical protein